MNRFRWWVCAFAFVLGVNGFGSLGSRTLQSGSVCFATPQPEDGTEPDIGLVIDPAPSEVTGEFRPGSHVKLYLPNLPYLAISHAINASLVRPSRAAKGWQYDLAVRHESIEDRVWEFELRKDVRFQDGSPFDADSVLLNMEAFQEQPFTFTKLHSILERVEKVDRYTVRFHLSEPYGVFLHDALWLQFYTPEYLERYGWNGKPTCPNLAEPGPYALGPYVLQSGYVEGDRSTPEVVLKANRDYWGEDGPKVETITLYNNLTLSEARDQALFEEGKIDLTVIPFADEARTVLSPYAKLASAASMNNYAMHFNLINGHPALRDDRIRFVMNQAIDREALLNLSMVGGGVRSPTTVSPNFYRVDDAIESLQSYLNEQASRDDATVEQLAQIVRNYQQQNGLDATKPLTIKLLVQESFLFLIQDIQYFLSRVNIDVQTEVVKSEKDVFEQLLSTYKNQNERSWDLLLWGNYDWYKHPWSAFFVYRPGTAWSTVFDDPQLIDFTDRIIRTNVQSEDYVPLVADLIRYVHQRNYMVFLPTPNNVYAVNKEVVFRPGRSAFVYLRELEVTDQHWSLRGNVAYPKERQRPLRPIHPDLDVVSP